MNLKQTLKITLLIVILAEEIKSVIKKDYKVTVDIDTDEFIRKLESIKKEH
ncbi:hypothetical protein [Staphylococcus kloosii]|jgi:hypothetical protein|uniref:hypothetical protein n=1 Tax=Staphylococcus kloosii TaxID=29384 RepID=UPI0018A000F7|nr:hypothetical protein [Staphylococcus kloosii]MBF7022525.1 hypothetical protein [Staphylococcus kloosii]